jgi:hypothetical protein
MDDFELIQMTIKEFETQMDGILDNLETDTHIYQLFDNVDRNTYALLIPISVWKMNEGWEKEKRFIGDNEITAMLFPHKGLESSKGAEDN